MMPVQNMENNIIWTLFCRTWILTPLPVATCQCGKPARPGDRDRPETQAWTRLKLARAGYKLNTETKSRWRAKLVRFSSSLIQVLSGVAAQAAEDHESRRARSINGCCSAGRVSTDWAHPGPLNSIRSNEMFWARHKNWSHLARPEPQSQNKNDSIRFVLLLS